MAGQAVGEKKKVVVAVAVVVFAVVVVAAAVVEVQVGLVGWPACWKRGPRSSFSSSRLALPSPSRASSCSNPSRIRPPSLQKHK